MPPKSDFKLRFKTKYKINPSNGCWEWSACRNKNGYGQLNISGRRVGAHRVSWLIFFGKIPSGMSVLHRCDNRACCNPEHLFLGTQKDNMADCARKNRTRTNPLLGSAHQNSKLIEEDILEARKLYSTGLFKQKTLGFIYGVKRETIGYAIRKQTWKHV